MELVELLVHTDICGISTDGLGLNFILLITTGFLAGFSHCVGMCGPLVSSFVLQQRTQQGKGTEHQQRLDSTSPLLLMQMGRLTTYVCLGAVAGAVGTLVRIGVVNRDWQSGMSIIMGVLLLIAGLNLLGWWPIHQQIVPRRILQAASHGIRTFMGKRSQLAHFGLGLSNGLLPCGAVYTMTLLAATSGNPLSGGLTMFIFGLGTLPSMLGIGLFAARASVQMRHHLYQVAAALILLVGVQLTLRGLALGGHLAHQSLAGFMLW